MRYPIQKSAFHFRTSHKLNFSRAVMKVSTTIFIAVNLLYCSNLAQCSRILGIFVMPSKSHFHLGSALMKGLAEQGHDVTFVSKFDHEYKPKNSNGTYRVVSIAGDENEKPDSDHFSMSSIPPIFFTCLMNSMASTKSDRVLSHPNVQELIRSDDHFDVVIIEQFRNDALKGFAYHYKAPLILFGSFSPNHWVNELVSNPAPPSYIPEMRITFEQGSLYDRTKNWLLTVFNQVNRHLILYPGQNKVMQKHFPGAPHLDEILYNASLVLMNSHVSTNAAAPRVPNMIDIGGYHVKPPKKLPKDLQTFLDDAKEGVVYFSMGSVLQSSNMPEEKRKIFLNAFAKLKQKVLWKWETDEMPDKPSNVYLHKWLPQTDVLAHPNVKLFITHGGILSTTESVYIGMQILGIPVFGDQRANVLGAESSGFGKALPYEELSQESLDANIAELLTNPKYMKNAKTRSNIMHDRLVHPMDEADYWIRYVIRHQGAPHLRVSGSSLPWYQYLSLDVALVVLLAGALSIYVNFKLASLIFSKCCGSKKVTKLKTQ